MHLVETETVESSNIAKVGYDKDEKELWIEFHDGGTYVYRNVPKQVHSDLLAADSIGRYFYKNIQNTYSWRKENA